MWAELMDPTGTVVDFRPARLPRVSIGWTLRNWLGHGAAVVTPDAPKIVAFLAGEGRDHAGRSHDDILGFTDEQFERTHDFIQWLFPLTTPSAAVPASPVLTGPAIAVARRSAQIQQRLRLAAGRKLAFLEDTGAWLSPFDHNQLRITRAIKSLRLLAGDREANAFRGEVLRLVRQRRADLEADTLNFWAAA